MPIDPISLGLSAAVGGAGTIAEAIASAPSFDDRMKAHARRARGLNKKKQALGYLDENFRPYDFSKMTPEEREAVEAKRAAAETRYRSGAFDIDGNFIKQENPAFEEAAPMGRAVSSMMSFDPGPGQTLSQPVLVRLGRNAAQTMFD